MKFLKFELHHCMISGEACCRRYRPSVVVGVVEAASRLSCDGARQRSALISAQSGYLSGVWAAETGCGTVDAPWQVRVRPGQGINVTLFDFNMPPSSANRTSPAATRSYPVAGIINARCTNLYLYFTRINTSGSVTAKHNNKLINLIN